jgi:hypothetical protein
MGCYTENRTKTVRGRVLRLEWLESRCLLSANFLGLNDPALAKLVKNRFADGSISRTDIIDIFRTVQSKVVGVVKTTEMQDLKTIVRNASALNMADYVAALSRDVVNVNRANAYYLGRTLGNLRVGSSADNLGNLINKWFYGTDLPNAGTYSYTTASGKLYGKNGPSHADERQGYLGDCYFISAMGSIAWSSQASIRSMFIGNGDGTWTVRFYTGKTADYVTVNRQLPVDTDNDLVYQGCGWSASSATNALWLSLLEKAYAEWNETGKSGRKSAVNSYGSIASGRSNNVFWQALSYNVTVVDPYISDASAKQTLIDAVTAKQAVVVSTKTTFVGAKALAMAAATRLESSHGYSLVGYNAKTGKFTLFNPWGKNHPTKVTWAQLRVLGDYFDVAYIKSSAARSVSANEVVVSYLSTPNVVVSSADTIEASAPNLKAVDAVMAEHGTDAQQQTATVSRLDGSHSPRTAEKAAARTTADWFLELDDLIDAIRL